MERITGSEYIDTGSGKVGNDEESWIKRKKLNLKKVKNPKSTLRERKKIGKKLKGKWRRRCKETTNVKSGALLVGTLLNLLYFPNEKFRKTAYVIIFVVTTNCYIRLLLNVDQN